MVRTTRATRHQLDADGKQVSPLVALDDQPRRRRAAPKKKEAAELPEASNEKAGPSKAKKEQGHAESSPAKRKEKSTSAPASKQHAAHKLDGEAPVKSSQGRGRPAKKAASGGANGIIDISSSLGDYVSEASNDHPIDAPASPPRKKKRDRSHPQEEGQGRSSSPNDNHEPPSTREENSDRPLPQKDPLPVPKRKRDTRNHPTTPQFAPKRRKITAQPEIVTTRPLMSLSRAKSTEAPKPKVKRFATEARYDQSGNLILPGQEILDSAISEDEFDEANRGVQAIETAPAALEEDHEGETTDVSSCQSSPEILPVRPTHMTPGFHRIETRVPQSARAVAAQPVIPREIPVAQTAPRRRWNFADSVSNSLGKFMPFSLFKRADEPSPSRGSANAPVHLHTAAPGSLSKTRALAIPSKNVNTKGSTKGPSNEDVNQLIYAVIQENCPDVASLELASNLQLSFAQTEAKSHAAHILPGATADSNSQKLLAALKQKYPGLDLTADSMGIRIQEVIAQQKLLLDFRKERSSKVQEPPARFRLDRIKVSTPSRKRKLRDTYDVIPNPKGKSYGMDLDYFADSSSDEDNDNQAEAVDFDRSHPQPSKRAKVQDENERGHRAIPRSPDSSPLLPSLDLTGPTPYTGDIFHSRGETSGNVFAKSQALNEMPRPQGAGKFEVPMDNYSDDSDEVESDEPASNAKSSIEAITNAANQRLGVDPPERGEPTSSAWNTMPKAGSAKGKAWSHTPYRASSSQSSGAPPGSGSADSFGSPSATPSNPPPAPTPAHAALPTASPTNTNGTAVPATATAHGSQTPHDPVALARAQANKYAPKTSSKLKSVSRLSSSSATSITEHPATAEQAVNPERLFAPMKAGNPQLSLCDEASLDFSPVIIDSTDHWPQIALDHLVEGVELDSIVADFMTAYSNSASA